MEMMLNQRLIQREEAKHLIETRNILEKEHKMSFKHYSIKLMNLDSMKVYLISILNILKDIRMSLKEIKFMLSLLMSHMRILNT